MDLKEHPLLGYDLKQVTKIVNRLGCTAPLAIQVCILTSILAFRFQATLKIHLKCIPLIDGVCQGVGPGSSL